MEQVEAQRWRCRACGRTFRVYPTGVSARQGSQRLFGAAVMVYLLGLSYGAVSPALRALGHPLAKTTVSSAVQAAAERVPGLKRSPTLSGVQTPQGTTPRRTTPQGTTPQGTTAALGADLTSVRVKGKWLPLGIAVDDLTKQALSLDALTGEDAATLVEWITPIATQVGARLLVTDDADGCKQVADTLALPHHVCTAHVQRTTDALVTALRPLAEYDGDGSLHTLGVSVEQALADLDHLIDLIHTRQPAQEHDLRDAALRYAQAHSPQKGETASLAYRLRALFLDRWNHWPRLTRYRTWRSPADEPVDGANNGCERSIGWWVKERYRSMRGYKREQSALNVSRLLCWCGNQLATGAVLAEVLA